MNTDLKSLAKIAEELQITRQAVYKRVNGSAEIKEQLKPHTVTNGARVYYTPQGQEIIKRLFVFCQPTATNDNQCEANVNQCEQDKTTGNSTNNNSECEAMVTDDNQCEQNDNQCEPKGTDTQSGAGAATTAAFNTAIEALTAQLNAKDEQLKAAQDNIKDLNKHIEELTNALTCSQEQQRALTEALTAAQALHAGTLQERLTVNEEQGEAKPDPDPEAVTVTPNKTDSEGEQPAEDPAPKKSFFARLFKRK